MGGRLTESGPERPSIRIRFAESGSEEVGRFGYFVSETRVSSNREIPELAPFASTLPESAPVGWDAPRADRELPLVYSGRGWIGGRELEVEARAEGDAHRLDVEGGTRVTLAARGAECFIRVGSGSGPDAARHALLGPGLALALALCGRFSLHASAVELEGRAAAILGESGSGKSTVAALAARRPGCRRIADDVVPVRARGDAELLLLPRFPQLKLPAAEQWIAEERLVTGLLLSLRRDAACAEASARRLSPRDAALRLLESTVAARLFSAELRERQLDAWVAAVGRCRVFDWRVPDDPGRLQEVVDSLESLAGS